MTSQVKERLRHLFAPDSVALIGASNSPEKWGNRILINLTRGGFKGRIFPVNPREKNVLGLTALSSISDLPIGVDLAVITIPTQGVIQAVRECISRDVKCCMVITSGFSETGPEGKKLEQEIIALAMKAGMPLVGPNCVGILSPVNSLHCHMMPVFPRKGNVAIIGQSGSTADIIAMRVTSYGMGVSHSISVGNEAVLQVADYLDYLADDKDTSVILGYIEGFRDGHKFLETAKKVTLKKPIILLKVGVSPIGAQATQSHTGALAGSDHIVEAALKQAGIIRAKNVDELVEAGIVFINQPLPRGNRVGIISPGGGWGVMAADACSKAGLDVAALDRETIDRFNAILPDTWSHNNPVDTIAGVRGEIKELIEVLAASPSIDGVIAVGIVAGMPSLWSFLEGSRNKEEMTEKFAQSAMNLITRSFDDLIRIRDRYQKPIVLCPIMPVDLGKILEAMSRIGETKGTATFLSPAQACSAYAALWNYASYRQRNS
jgi:acyl-CoA synthetase (NDP forming)